MEDLEQLEFFDSVEKTDNLKALKTQQFNFKELWRFRQVLFLLIYSIVLLIIGFALGVEKGKKSQIQENVLPQTNVEGSESKFVIQIASFKNSATAKEELQKLRNKGFNAYGLSSKQYIKVFVGPIKTREEAQAKLKALKSRYPNCSIIVP